jgi:hypothetical protein
LLLLYPGILSSIIALISGPYLSLIFVDITVSPGISNANSESLFPVPPTVIIAFLPSAYFGSPATAPAGPGTVLNNPGDDCASALACDAAFPYAAASALTDACSTLNVDINWL